jgi:hypothetical protein
MPLGTTWKDIGRLIFYALLVVAFFFATAYWHGFFDELIPLPYHLGAVIGLALGLFLFERIVTLITSGIGPKAADPGDGHDHA